MRPYLVLCAVVVMAVAAFGQQPQPPVPRVYGPCFYGCGPYIPMLTTPEISLQTASPNPVGASNATTGLVAGATNGTLSEIQGSTSSTYTVPVWYQGGGAPIIAPNVNLYPQGVGHVGHPMHEHEMREEPREEKHAAWVFYSGSEHTISAVDASGSAKGMKKASHVYTNEDIERQNQNNGNVKLNGKSEKM